MEEHTLDGLHYLIRYPSGYVRGQRYPVLFFFHGAGTRGVDIGKLKSNPFFTHINAIEPFPFVVIAPHCTENTWFDLFEGLQALIRAVAASDFCDKTRIYAIGASMGGYATWQLAMSMPEYFAAIAPVCGGGMYWNARRIVNIPIWAFHGGKDPVVFPEESRKMVDAVNQRGGNAKLTVYPENGHDAWTDTYSNPELYRWFLSHKKSDAPVLRDDLSSPQKFG